MRLLISREDHGVHSWIDVRGLRGGVTTWRTRHETPPDPPVVTTISTADVAGLFGDDARIGGEERAEAMQARLRHFAYRDGV